MSLSFPSIWVPGSSFILASCLIGKEAISSILLDQWCYIIINMCLSCHINRNKNVCCVIDYFGIKKCFLCINYMV